MALDRVAFFQDPAHPALRETLAAWHSAHPRAGVLALLPEAQRDAVPALQSACRSSSIPLVGAIFPALLFENQFRSDRKSVV